MGQAIAVANQKGGVGKTTMTINLGAALAEKGKGVLLIDLDPQGHLTEGCGLTSRYTDSGNNLADFLTNRVNEGLSSIIFPAENFEVMPSHIALFAAERELILQRAGEKRLKRVLGPVISGYDFVLIDCPPTLGPLTDNALVAAERVLVPIQAEDTSVRALEMLFDELTTLEEVVEVHVEIVAIVPNLVSSNLVSRRILGDLRGAFPDKVTDFEIRRRVDLAKAWHEGKSIFTYNPRCDVVATFQRLAGLIMAVS